MTSNEYTIHYKISLLHYARCSTVAAACRAFKISRTRYYEIAHDFERFGIAGLLPKPKCPKMPNKGQDSFYLGTIKGIGRIYSQAAVDCNLKLCICQAL